jgi:DNA-binding GntR family transcriptional regulator
MQAIERSTFADQTAEAVRALILDGEIEDGARVNEVRLAARIGVSRTPLREALNRLAAEGLVEARPGYGFFVRPLTIDEFEQTYAIRPILDPEALRIAGIPTDSEIERLSGLNARMRSAADPGAALALDDAFHLGLIDACPNKVLLELVRQMIARTRRYDLALFRETKNKFVASDEHERILQALRDNNLAVACAALRENMESGREPVRAWLAARKKETKKGAA